MNDGVNRWFDDTPVDNDDYAEQQSALTKTFIVLFGQYVPADPTGTGPVTLTTQQARLLSQMGNAIANSSGNAIITKVKGTSSSAYLPSFTPTGNTVIRALNEANQRAITVAGLIGFPASGRIDPDATNVVTPITNQITSGALLDPIISDLKNAGYINSGTDDSVTVQILFNPGISRRIQNQINNLADQISAESPY